MFIKEDCLLPIMCVFFAEFAHFAECAHLLSVCALHTHLMFNAVSYQLKIMPA